MLQVSRLSERHAKSSRAVGTRPKTTGPCAKGTGLLNVSKKSKTVLKVSRLSKTMLKVSLFCESLVQLKVSRQSGKSMIKVSWQSEENNNISE